jgi:hypothetical protein
MLNRTGRWAPSPRASGSRALLSLRIQVYRPFNSHARCTPWSVFQDGRVTSPSPAAQRTRGHRRCSQVRSAAHRMEVSPRGGVPVARGTAAVPMPAGGSHAAALKHAHAESRLRHPLSLQRFHVCFKVCIRDPFHRSLAVLVCYRSRHHI